MKNPAKKIILKPMLSMEDALAMASATIGMAEPKAGDLVLGKGVYIGQWEPQDEGVKLGKIFNVYAAPEDLRDEDGGYACLDFDDAVQRVHALKNWHGHDGGSFDDEFWLFHALRDGEYHGQWFLPPRELLRGDGENRRDDSLFSLKYAGALRNTFSEKGEYWSCTKAEKFMRSVYYTEFDSGKSYVDYSKERYARPIRVEPKL